MKAHKKWKRVKHVKKWGHVKYVRKWRHVRHEGTRSTWFRTLANIAAYFQHLFLYDRTSVMKELTNYQCRSVFKTQSNISLEFFQQNEYEEN